MGNLWGWCLGALLSSGGVCLPTGEWVATVSMSLQLCHCSHQLSPLCQCLSGKKNTPKLPPPEVIVDSRATPPRPFAFGSDWGRKKECFIQRSALPGVGSPRERAVWDGGGPAVCHGEQVLSRGRGRRGHACGCLPGLWPSTGAPPSSLLPQPASGRLHSVGGVTSPGGSALHSGRQAGRQPR